MVILLSFTGGLSFMVSVLRKSLFFPGFRSCGTWCFRGPPEYTGINGVCGAAEPKRQLRGSMEWSITGKSVCCD